MRCRSSTGLVPENSSSFLTPSATVTLPLRYSPSLFPVIPGRCVSIEPGISRFRVRLFEAPRNDGRGNVAPSLMRRVCILPKFKSGNGTAVDFIGAIRQTHGAHGSIVARKPGLVGDAGAAESLDRLVEDLQRHPGGGDLDHGDFELGALVADLVHHVGGLEAEQPVQLDVDAGFRNALFPDRVLDDL